MEDSSTEKKSGFIEQAGGKTKVLGQSLAKLLGKHIKSNLPDTQSNSPTHTPPGQQKSNTRFLTFLKGIPPFLILLFLFAQYWDFDQVSIEILGNTLSLDGLLTMISVSGLIGYLTNWIAITMLFKPKLKRPILGQGLIPAQKDRIAFRLAQAVSKDLINPEIIKQKLIDSDLIGIYRRKGMTLVHSIIQNDDFRAELKQLITEYITGLVEDPELRADLAKEIILKLENSLEDKSIEKIALKTYMLVRGENAQKIIENAISKLPQNMENVLDKLDLSLDKVPVLIEEKSEQLEEWVSKSLFNILQQFDVHQLVEENVKKFDEDKISNLIKGTTNEQFQYIQYLGALLGMIGGFVIWQPIGSVIVIGILVLSIWGLDNVLGDK